MFNSSSNAIVRCYGDIDFDSNGNFTASNWSAGGSFLGPVNGDASLLPLSRLANVINFNDGLVTGRNTSRQALATNGTIAWAGSNGNPFTTVPISLSGNVTGIIMGNGDYDGQLCFVVNTSSSFSITFAAQATSVVAGGSSIVLEPQGYMCLMWNSNTGLWYSPAATIG